MSGRRSYRQACPVAHALDIVGERWALLVVRELRLGPRRYADLQANLPGIGPSVLAQRLRDLQRTGVIQRRTLPTPVSGHVYELTRWGGELEPVFDALAAWGMRSPVVPLEGDVSEDSVVLGLRSLFTGGDPAWTATYRLRLEREAYTVGVTAGALAELSRADPTGPVDATIETDRATLHALLVGSTTLVVATKAGRVRGTGAVGVLRRLLGSGSAASRGWFG